MKRSLLLLTFVLAMQQLPAQISDDNLVSSLNHGVAVYEPLWLQTNGGGQIMFYKNGQLLQVGREYTMIAIPERGYVFKNWELVNITTVIATFTNQFGSEVTTNTVVSPTGQFVENPMLKFTMQQATVFTEGLYLQITSNSGWQANFAPRGK